MPLLSEPADCFATAFHLLPGFRQDGWRARRRAHSESAYRNRRGGIALIRRPLSQIGGAAGLQSASITCSVRKPISLALRAFDRD